MLFIPVRYRRRAPLVAALALAAAWAGGPGALAPAPAHANANQISIMVDDDQLVYRDDRTRDRTMRTMKAQGVDMVRVTVLWSVVANGARDTPAQHRRFRATEPSTYPLRNWDRYDGVVRTARRLGLTVYFDVTGPGPSWSHARPPAGDTRDGRTWRPSTRAFYDFVVAVGKRYSGHYRARNHQTLPAVRVWALWNEPNQGGWLTPQWAYNPALHRVAPASPAIYRDLYLNGRRALDATGHGHDFIMAGETAPLGSSAHSSRSPIAPKQFIRELFCVDGAGHPYGPATAGALGCSAFARLGPLRAAAWAHHPYTKLLAPTQRDANHDAITMANIGELPDVLDRAARSSRHLPEGLAIMSTEFGYETNPPDPFVGIAPDRQAEYINEGDFLAFFAPRVYGQTQFLLTDAAPLTQYRRGSKRYWFTYQSGLQFLGGRPKPSFGAYRLPLFAFRLGSDPSNGQRLYGIWGQLRFRPRPISPLRPDYVQLEFLASGGGSWRTAGPPIAVTNAQAFFTGAIDVPGPGSLRAHWGPSGSRGRYSRAISVSG